MKRELSIAILLVVILFAIVFVACSQPVSFDIDFMVDGEVYSTISTSGKSVLVMPSNPTKEGYVFDGWFWDEEIWKKPFTANSVLDAPLSSDIKVFAKFSKEEEKLDGLGIKALGFDKNNVTLSRVVENSKEEFNFVNYIEVKNDSKWELYLDLMCRVKVPSKMIPLDLGENKVYILVTDSSENICVYTVEIYRNKIKEIVFNSNGGTDVANIQIEEHSAYGELITPQRRGYNFIGWYFKNNKITENTILEIEKEEIELIAKWDAIEYTIQYFLNGGTVENGNLRTYTVETVFDFKLPTNEGCIGYWYTEKSCRNHIEKLDNTIGNLKLYAKYWYYTPHTGDGYLTFYFGEYPKTLKKDSVTITNEKDERGYYLGSDNMYYAKRVADIGAANIYFSSGEKIINGNTYYFRVEALRWKVLKTTNNQYMMITDDVIDIKQYHHDCSERVIEGNTIYANNYKYSDIRNWLNTEFMNNALNSAEQEVALTMNVNNSASGSYGCENTMDKVAMLSYNEAINNQYFASSSERRTLVTDYVRVLGKDSAGWWLRTPENYSSHVYDVNAQGELDNIIITTETFTGVRPMITINMNLIPLRQE